MSQSINCILAVADELDEDHSSVSLCQIRVQFDGSTAFDDHTLLLILSTLKMYDFHLGQPTWGPSDVLIYLCEHQLKTGLHRSILNREFNTILNKAGPSSRSLTWTCV